MTPHNWPEYYTEFDNEMTELLEEQSPYKPEIVSYSEVFRWDTCPRQYYYNFVLGLQAEEMSATITTGTKGHRLLQTFYESLKAGLTKEQAHEKVKETANKLLYPPPKAGLMKTLDLSNSAPAFDLLKAWTIVDNYIRDTEFDIEAALVENRFLISASLFSDDPVLQSVQIGFTPDVVFKRPGDMYTVEDAKFVQRAWSKSKLNRFQQAKLYQIFLRRMGYNVTQSCIRFFNVQTSEVKPQYYTLKDEEEKTLITDFMRAVKEVIIYRQQPISALSNTRRTMNYTACQFCAFEFPCTLEAEGKDASKTLQNLYVRKDYDYSK